MTDLRTRHTRALLLAAASVVLVALVAVAASGYRLGGSSSARPNSYAVDTILTIVIALYIIAAVAVVVGMFWGGIELRRNPRQETKRQRTWRMIFVLLAGAALVTVAAERYHLRSHPRPPTETPALGNPSKGAHKKPAATPAAHHAQLRLAPLLAILGASGIAVAAFLVAERRRKRRLPRDFNAAEALSDVLDETLDDLRVETDPRRAVIAAYARLERVLGAHGEPRQDADTPEEHLARVLGHLDVDRRAVRRLVDLFVRAKFSQHEVDAGMKDEAIAALEHVRDELRAAAAETGVDVPGVPA